MRSRASLLALVSLAFGGHQSALRGDLIVLGEPFGLAQIETGDQKVPSVAVSADGSFVVAWQSEGSFGSDPDTSIQIRRFDRNGNPLGDQAQVNTHGESGQFRPSIARGSDDRIVVTWTSGIVPGGDSSGVSVQGQILAADGTQMGSQFQVNTYGEGDQGRSAVAMLPDDRFVVAWQSEGSDGDDSFGLSIQGQIFETSGAPFGSEFQINTTTGGDQLNPAVAAMDDGSFWVLWEGLYGPLLEYTVVGKKFGPSGEVLIEEAVIPTGDGYFSIPALASGSNSSVLTAWRSMWLPTIAIHSRLIGSDGVIGETTYLGGVCDGCAPDSYASVGNMGVSADPNGGFVAVWKETLCGPNPPCLYRVVGNQVDIDGAALSSTGTTLLDGLQVSVSSDRPVGFAGNGKLVLAWAASTDALGENVYGLLLEIPTMFRDGFESGDNSSWITE